MGGTGVSGWDRLLAGEVEEYRIRQVGPSVPDSGPESVGVNPFKEGLLRGLCQVPGLRSVGANVVSPWLGADGVDPVEGLEASVPVGFKRPSGWYTGDPRFRRVGEQSVDVKVRFEKVSAGWDDVSGLVRHGPRSRVWYQLGLVLGEGLADEAERVYHRNPVGGLLPNVGRFEKAAISAAASREDLLETLWSLPYYVGNCMSNVPVPALSYRGRFLVNPKFWGPMLPPSALLPVEPYMLGWDPFLRAARTGGPGGRVLAAFGDWEKAFTIVESGVVTVRLVGDGLVAETVTAGSVTPPQFVSGTVLRDGGFGPGAGPPSVECQTAVVFLTV